MTEFNYPECTTSVITALAIFRKHYPTYRKDDIQYVSSHGFVYQSLLTFPRRVMTKAVSYVHKAQRPDGVWFGSWGICFTYATQFALESLSLVGETYENSTAVRRACDFLVSKQRTDGGWGESYKVRLPLRCADIKRRADTARGTVVRDERMGGARADAGRADLLGDDGAHLRALPTAGTY